jgi:hypothetical protein
MLDISRIVLDGLILSAAATLWLVITLYVNPRLWLQNYPPAIQAQVPPKTAREKRLSLMVGVPFLLLLFAGPFISALLLKRRAAGQVPFLALAAQAFGVVFVFNLVDWLVLDWLVFCVLTPPFVVVPGSEGMARYKDVGYHTRGFVIGTLLSAVTGLVIGGVVYLVPLV